MDGSYGEIWEVENYWVLGIVKRASLLKTEWVDSRHNSSFFDIFEKNPSPKIVDDRKNSGFGPKLNEPVVIVVSFS